MSAAPVARRLRALSRIGACAALTGACGFPCDEDTEWDRHVYHLYTVAESEGSWRIHSTETLEQQRLRATPLEPSSAAPSRPADEI